MNDESQMQDVTEASANDAAPPPEHPPTDSPTIEELFGDTPPESSLEMPVADITDNVASLERRVAELRQQEEALNHQIAVLQSTYTKTLQSQMAETQATLGRLIQDGLRDLEQRRQSLQISVEQLERRQDRIRAEMRTTFAGTSQELAIRVQGFKDYLVGSLQDLVTAAEQLELVPERPPTPAPQVVTESQPQAPANPQFGEQAFQEQTKQIRALLDRYRTMPDYYGPPWQLRRTFEPIHAERVSNWFFTQGGRGALKSMGSRLQNILVAAAAISILRKLYGDRLRTLILANTPERLGEWRRGLQDCLGVARADFGPERGIILFEAAEPLTQKAERLVKQDFLPIIIVDDSEDQVSLALLQFPLLLAFAADPYSRSY